jgi:hypothetical protein
VIGNAGEGKALALAQFPRGQGDAQDGSDPLGVLAEGLVEIAQAKEDDGVRILLLDLLVLLENGTRLQRRAS